MYYDVKKENTDMKIVQAKPAELVASIDHPLAKILLLLPIRTLLRFKSVSKDWLALITNPIFCHLRNPNPNPAAGLLLPFSDENQLFELISFRADRSSTPPFWKLEFAEDPSGVRVLQSCNGLLLCCSDRGLKHRYYVYNPTTKCCSELPNSDERSGLFSGICGMSLAFDPVKSRHYKVVCVWSMEVDTANSQFLIEIYSSETRSWQLCGERFAALVKFSNGVFWNGSIHWLGIGNGDSLYFNIDHQVLDKMPMLPLRYGWNSRSDYYFGESCDHLHFIEMRGPTVKFNVYEMKMDYSEWFVKYQVDLGPVVFNNPEMIWGHVNPMGWYSLVFSVFTIIRGEQEEEAFLVLQTPRKAIRYNLVCKTFENLHDFEGEEVKGSLRYPGISGFQYIESLCSV